MRSPQKGVCSLCLIVQLNHSSAGKNAAHFQEKVVCFKGAGRLMADVLFNGPTVARIRIDRMGFPLPGWNLNGKGVGSQSYYCNDVIPGHALVPAVWVRFFSKHGGMKFPSDVRQKSTVCPCYQNIYQIEPTNCLRFGNLVSIEGKTPSGLVCLPFFLSCVGTFLLKRLGLPWFRRRENEVHYRPSDK